MPVIIHLFHNVRWTGAVNLACSPELSNDAYAQL